MGKNLFWLASYPKSGNTWVRLFLANYLARTEQPFPINQLGKMGYGDVIGEAYGKIAGRPHTTLTEAAVNRLRPALQRALARNPSDVLFVKTHNANIRRDGERLISPEVTRGALYIVRNPLDMVPSYADHYGITPEAASIAIGQKTNLILANQTNVAQYIGSWSDHVLSWADDRKLGVLVLRYEDLQADPRTAFVKLLRHIGLEPEDGRLKKAIEFSSFKEARRQEDEHTFVERSRNSKSFFRSGKVGAGRAELSPLIQQRIMADHGDVMRRFGYLED